MVRLMNVMYILPQKCKEYIHMHIHIYVCMYTHIYIYKYMSTHF